MADQFETSNDALVGADTVAGVGGTLGAIPFLNVLAPGITAGFANQREQAIRDTMAKNAAAVNLPRFNGSYQTEQYAGDYDPTAYATPEAAMYQQIQDSPEARQMMVQALQRMQGFADQSAGSSQEQLGRYQALDEANQLASSREGAIAAAAQRRGQGGTLASSVMQQQAAQAAANRAQGGTLNAAAQAALQRFQGMQGVMQGSQALRGQDLTLNAQNADIINRFNMANTGARNATNAANTDLRNSAGLRNINTKQGLNHTNTGIRNESMNRDDRNAMNSFGAQTTKSNNINNALSGQANQANDANKDAQAAGQEGFGNLKSIMSMMGGGFGG